MYRPRDLGFPESFATFRAAQEDAIDYALTSERRFTAIGAPPGVGKSGIALALAKLLGGRTVILTANRGLEDQYLKSLHGMGMLDMRGRSNYRCWEGGNCETGALLGCKDRYGCPYLGSLRVWNEADIGLSNYAWWITANNSRTQVKPPDTLICDEAGLAFDWMSRALDYKITEREARECGLKIATMGEEIDTWVAVCPALAMGAELRLIEAKATMEEYRGSKREHAAQEVRRIESLVDRAGRLAILNTNWVITREEGSNEGRIWHFNCIWPGRFREQLFRGVPRVILLGATIRPKTLALLGIHERDIDFREWPRQFPAANGPVVWLPILRPNGKLSELNNDMSAEDERLWLETIRDILDWGKDRNGLIHTVSYARARRIADYLKGYRFILNGAADPESASARDAYQTFGSARVGTALVSPSFSTGWDFPGKIAEWQILAKIAFPDPRSKLMQARTADDRTYGLYVAAQELQQGSGRIVRSDSDRGMTILIDPNWSWFRNASKPFLSAWFKARREDSLPAPLARIAA